MPPSGITLRIRTQLGTWRLSNIQNDDTFQIIKERLAKEHGAHFTHKGFYLDPNKSIYVPDDFTIGESKVSNGDMIYTSIDEEKCAHHDVSTKKKITKDGKIVNQDVSNIINNSGFRAGLLPLRSMKMHWTLNEFISLDEQFVYKVKAQEKSFCKLVSVSTSAMQGFQNYVHNFDFRVMRVAFLYGSIADDNTVNVEVIYEPPQETTEADFQILEDPKIETIDYLTNYLGLKKVGWIFAHPPREKGFFFSGPEILFTAEQQLESVQGVGDTSFVTIKTTLDENSHVLVEAFQVSKQCMEMVAEGVLQTSTHLGMCKINPTFTAIVEGKEASEVDNSFFVVTTPIEQNNSQKFVHKFPVANRIDSLQTRDTLKAQLSKAGKDGWTFLDLLSDFQLLLYLTEFLSVTEDLPLICQSIIDRNVPLNEGYLLLLRSIAGLD